MLTGQRRVVIQAARQREVDTEVYEYAGTAGIDRPRIVQVGYHTTLLDRLRRQMALERLVAELVTGTGDRPPAPAASRPKTRLPRLLAIRVVDSRFQTLAYGAATGQAVRRDMDEPDAGDVRAALREDHAISRLEEDALRGWRRSPTRRAS